MSEPQRNVSSLREGSGEMFNAIAERYDMINRILSIGIDQHWRSIAVEKLLAERTNWRSPLRFLDLATGTGDLAIAIAEGYPRAEVHGTDPSSEMMRYGRRKLSGAELLDRVSMQLGDAQAIDAATDSYDGVSIAFGIRNVPDRSLALREMARVTKPGGRVVILELSEPDHNNLIGKVARFHVHTMVPKIGALLSGAREYAYLQRSIEAFPPASQFAEQIRQAGLEVLEVLPLTFGVAHIYVATPALSH